MIPPALEQPLVYKIDGIDVLISCIAWEHLELQIPWIEAAKEAGVKRNSTSSVRFNVLVCHTPSSTWAVGFRFSSQGPVRHGGYWNVFAQIISDPRILNRHVFAYTEVLSMNEIRDIMATMSKAEIKEIIETYRKKLQESSESAHYPSNIMNTANFNMGQYRISWCIRGDNTPEYADYLRYLDF
ncbi:hypothetical protein DL769_001770 [Monosporascus sp. CRB-8-3]|nr:hypothetical protein DL769_001770 [Monosporascus sp. CRB-8-3]